MTLLENAHKKIGAGILAFDKGSGKALFCRRSLQGDHPNTWSFFGGTLEEKDRIPKNTAIREFIEESGCNDNFQISKMPFHINDENHLKFYTYIGIFERPFNIRMNEENLDHAWFHLEHLPENLHPGLIKMFEERFEDIIELRNSILL